MNNLSPERRKVILVCCAVACMSSGPVLLRGHMVLMFVWLAVMLSALIYAMVLLARLKGKG